MKRPDWVELLELLYQKTPPEWDSEEPDGHPFVKETNYDAEEVDEVLDELVSRRLVEEEPVIERGPNSEYPTTSGASAYELNTKGFDVAHDRELSKRQTTLNRSLVFFTFVLVVPELLSLADIPSGVGSLAALLLFGLMLYMMYSGDLFAES